jgi:hypothetical protein
MEIDPADPLRPASRDDALPVAPLAGTRSQSMQRLQIGLFGLAAMVLLVSLANIIINNAEQNEARVVPEAAPTVAADDGAAPVRDPLAEAGVVPDMPAQDTSEPRGRSGNAPALQP